jgi:hypothetical protein
MKKVVVAALLIVANSLSGGPSAFAQVPFRYLTPAETKAFDECLHTAWVYDYCRDNAHWFLWNYSQSFLACVYANGGGKLPMNGRTWFNTDDYCRSRAQRRWYQESHCIEQNDFESSWKPHPSAA